MMNQKLGDLFMFGAEAGEGAVVAAHSAVAAILAAEFEDLHDGAHENFFF